MRDFYDNDRAARMIMDDIAYIARAMNELGIPAGDKLFTSIEAMTTCIDTYRDLNSEAVETRYRESNQATTNMINGIMAMAELTSNPA